MQKLERVHQKFVEELVDAGTPFPQAVSKSDDFIERLAKTSIGRNAINEWTDAQVKGMNTLFSLAGKVNGEVLCKNSEVSGTVEGKITVNQLLILKASSKILGDIVTSKLSIEPGALFTGNCKMGETDNNGGSAAKGKEPEKTVR